MFLLKFLRLSILCQCVAGGGMFTNPLQMRQALIKESEIAEELENLLFELPNKETIDLQSEINE